MRPNIWTVMVPGCIAMVCSLQLCCLLWPCKLQSTPPSEGMQWQIAVTGLVMYALYRLLLNHKMIHAMFKDCCPDITVTNGVIDLDMTWLHAYADFRSALQSLDSCFHSCFYRAKTHSVTKQQSLTNYIVYHIWSWTTYNPTSSTSQLTAVMQDLSIHHPLKYIAVQAASRTTTGQHMLV